MGKPEGEGRGTRVFCAFSHSRRLLEGPAHCRFLLGPQRKTFLSDPQGKEKVRFLRSGSLTPDSQLAKTREPICTSFQLDDSQEYQATHGQAEKRKLLAAIRAVSALDRINEHGHFSFGLTLE
jgi:hypothetical protein